MNTTLLIMAAGIGSRFGTGIKQLEPVDDAGHIIMDYSIHDAIEAGFNHVVFIIRKDIEKEFKEVIGDRIAFICSSHNVTVDYAFQDINDIPGTLPEGRTKPWGTGQAVLAAKDVIKTPFIVINADDYYGKEGFKAVHEYLVNGGKSCMAGFVLKNTLSDNGGVTRGICKMDDKLIIILDFEKIVTDISPETGLKMSDMDDMGQRERCESPILIAEDSPLLSRLITDCLKKAGYTNLIVTMNGQEAWDKLQEFEKAGNVREKVHCIITDIEMPLMDGHRLTKLVKTNDNMKKIPLIIFSSLVNEEMRIKGEQLGADAQLTKPEIGSLVSAIDDLIDKSMD